ncbi:MAG TPA: methyltransferase domain-containing protein [Desulfotomaculum sp.]|nr:methyltransferase domain-containing protein [Desulfotomaculum sp.]
MSVSEIFDLNSHIYATAVNERFYACIATALAEKVVNRITPRRILETGSGTGAATVVLSRCFPKAEILATDPSEKMLSHNQEKRFQNVCFLRASVEEIDGFSGGDFDLIFGNVCYHWFPLGTAARLIPLLAPGGTMAFSVPVSGPEREAGNKVLLQICRRLGVRGRQGTSLLSTNRLRREFAAFQRCTIERMALRETHPPALFGALLRARGSWAFLFGPRAPHAESLWRKLTAGRDTVTLCWNIALVVAQK